MRAFLSAVVFFLVAVFLQPPSATATDEYDFHCAPTSCDSTRTRTVVGAVGGREDLGDLRVALYSTTDAHYLQGVVPLEEDGTFTARVRGGRLSCYLVTEEFGPPPSLVRFWEAADGADDVLRIGENGVLAEALYDSDDDGMDDACDTDDDNDGIADPEDAFPFDPAESLDTDGDGIGNNADPDDDNDGVLDMDDACAQTPLGEPDWFQGCSCSQITLTPRDCPPDACNGENWEDYPADGTDTCSAAVVTVHSCALLSSTYSASCDPDDDNDGVLDAADPCPAYFNDTTGDPCVHNDCADLTLEDSVGNSCIHNDCADRTPEDPVGNACDHDEDDDGVEDTVDSCPLASNADQIDLDVDAIGDACDDEVILPLWPPEGACTVSLHKWMALARGARSSGFYRVVLLNCSPDTSYDCTIYHHTDIDYPQWFRRSIRTDADGNGRSMFWSRDNVLGDSYNFAVCGGQTSNRVYNNRVQVSYLRGSGSTASNGIHTFNAMKNTGANVILNGIEVVPHNLSGWWSYRVRLAEGDNLIELVSERDDDRRTNVGANYFTVNYTP